MKRKTLAILLTLVMAFGLVAMPLQVQAQETFEPFEAGNHMIWPLESNYVVDFGYGFDLYAETYTFITLMRIQGQEGLPVRVPMDGRVDSIGVDEIWGNYLIIDHGNGWMTRYGQLMESIWATEGYIVRMGQVIGGVGSGTPILGPQLMFQVTYNDIPVDPHNLIVYGIVTFAEVTSEPAAPEPAPQPTPEPTPAPVAPAPITVTPIAAAGLITTENLVSTIPPAPVAGQPLQYTVQAGETLWSIAFNYYGSMSGATVNRIMAANRNIIPASGALTAGMVITLPAQGLRQPVMQAHLADAAGVYLVRAGDTLADIAYHFFGDRTQWRRIREANTPRVGSNNMIIEGQWLIIPR